MFDSMRRDAPWNIDGPLLWGYFFINQTPEPLRKAGEQLEAIGYRVVDISERSDAAASARWRLHVEKIETHTVESLHVRNQELYALASKMGLNSYDGMDVGPAP
ncbi:ribonuclease E inhibitor RraB [Povalibacter sp.]|uniref:ribonuclease E inhibitor RraB n=1 Tax=Povalibacter sp. TaxID=1962978 RepID=UPI0032C234B0